MCTNVHTPIDHKVFQFFFRYNSKHNPDKNTHHAEFEIVLLTHQWSNRLSRLYSVCYWLIVKNTYYSTALS